MARTVSPEEQLARLRRFRELQRDFALFFYRPYAKQRLFHALGATKRERMLMAANQVGKTLAAGQETAYHVTGLYPEWWEGKRIHKANRGWVGSKTAEVTRDGAQRILCGPIGQWFSGALPKDLIVDCKRSRGVADALETLLVKHVPTGDVSQITFKAYSDGRESWQSETLDWLWFDEEPPEEIYSEGMTRTNTTMGPVYLTFTPLLGMSKVVVRFLKEGGRDRAYVGMTLDDAEHYTAEDRERIIEQYPVHERDARAKGIPMVGSGLIYPVAEEALREPQIVFVPSHWKQLVGMDFGWEHPTAAVNLGWDVDNDVVHVLRCYRQARQIPVVHAAAIKPWGKWLPIAWPADATETEKGTGEQVKTLYSAEGLQMLSEHAAFADERGRGVEPGCLEILQRMQTGRFKVNTLCWEWFEECRMYHRADGKIVKQYDDLMDATRYGVVMLRYAVPEIYAVKPKDRWAREQGPVGTWMSQ